MSSSVCSWNVVSLPPYQPKEIPKVARNSVYYKILAHNLHACHGGEWDYRRNLGDWTFKLGYISPCYSGYHVCSIDQLFTWLLYYVPFDRPVVCDYICEVEVGEQLLQTTNKYVTNQLKIVKIWKIDKTAAKALIKVELTKWLRSTYKDWEWYGEELPPNDYFMEMTQRYLSDFAERSKNRIWLANKLLKECCKPIELSRFRKV